MKDFGWSMSVKYRHHPLLKNRLKNKIIRDSTLHRNTITPHHRKRSPSTPKNRYLGQALRIHSKHNAIIAIISAQNLKDLLIVAAHLRHKIQSGANRLKLNSQKRRLRSYCPATGADSPVGIDPFEFPCVVPFVEGRHNMPFWRWFRL